MSDAPTPLEKLADLARVLADRVLRDAPGDQVLARELAHVPADLDVESRPVAGSPMRVATLDAIAQQTRGLLDHVITPAMLAPSRVVEELASVPFVPALDALFKAYGFVPANDARQFWWRSDDVPEGADPTTGFSVEFVVAELVLRWNLTA